MKNHNKTKTDETEGTADNRKKYFVYESSDTRPVDFKKRSKRKPTQRKFEISFRHWAAALTPAKYGDSPSKGPYNKPVQLAPSRRPSTSTPRIQTTSKRIQIPNEGEDEDDDDQEEEEMSDNSGASYIATSTEAHKGSGSVRAVSSSSSKAQKGSQSSHPHSAKSSNSTEAQKAIHTSHPRGSSSSIDAPQGVQSSHTSSPRAGDFGHETTQPTATHDLRQEKSSAENVFVFEPSSDRPVQFRARSKRQITKRTFRIPRMDFGAELNLETVYKPSKPPDRNGGQVLGHISDNNFKSDPSEKNDDQEEEMSDNDRLSYIASSTEAHKDSGSARAVSSNEGQTGAQAHSTRSRKSNKMHKNGHNFGSGSRRSSSSIEAQKSSHGSHAASASSSDIGNKTTHQISPAHTNQKEKYEISPAEDVFTFEPSSDRPVQFRARSKRQITKRTFTIPKMNFGADLSPEEIASSSKVESKDKVVPHRVKTSHMSRHTKTSEHRLSSVALDDEREDSGHEERHASTEQATPGQTTMKSTFSRRALQKDATLKQPIQKQNIVKHDTPEHAISKDGITLKASFPKPTSDGATPKQSATPLTKDRAGKSRQYSEIKGLDSIPNTQESHDNSVTGNCVPDTQNENDSEEVSERAVDIADDDDNVETVPDSQEVDDLRDDFQEDQKYDSPAGTSERDEISKAHSLQTPHPVIDDNSRRRSGRIRKQIENLSSPPTIVSSLHEHHFRKSLTQSAKSKTENKSQMRRESSPSNTSRKITMSESLHSVPKRQNVTEVAAPLTPKSQSFKQSKHIPSTGKSNVSEHFVTPEISDCQKTDQNIGQRLRKHPLSEKHENRTISAGSARNKLKDIESKDKGHDSTQKLIENYFGFDVDDPEETQINSSKKSNRNVEMTVPKQRAKRKLLNESKTPTPQSGGDSSDVKEKSIRRNTPNVRNSMGSVSDSLRRKSLMNQVKTPAVQPRRPSQSALHTPNPTPKRGKKITVDDQKDESLFVVTPKSGPAYRGQRRVMPSHTQKNVPSRPGPTLIQSDDDVQEVRVWQGSGKRRKLSDVTDLDVILSCVEQTAWDYRQGIDSPACRKAINSFARNLQEQLRKSIVLSDRIAKIKSTANSSKNAMRARRRELLALQREYAELQKQIADMQKQKTEPSKQNGEEMGKISEFLENIKELQQI